MSHKQAWCAQYQLPGQEPFWFGGVSADNYEQAVAAACDQKRRFFTDDTKLLAVSPGHGILNIGIPSPVVANACCQNV